MDPKSKHRDDILFSLSVVIQGLSLAEKLATVTPAKTVFSVASDILTMIRDSMANEDDYVDLGLTCNAVCAALDRGLKEKRLSDLDGSVVDAIGQLTTTLADIRSKVAERSKQNILSRALHAKSDGQTIASWKVDLNKNLLIFNTELGLNIYGTVSDVRDGVTKTHIVVADTHSAVSEVQRGVVDTHLVVADTHNMIFDIHRQMLGRQGGVDNRCQPTSALGESPPLAPRACSGRNELIEKVVELAENLTSTVLVGPGGIGKTSVALTVLHHDRIKRRFGTNRRFIRCDQFPASCTHLLARLSKVIGAGIENPEDLASLRRFLSSTETLIVLDNADSILDPQGMDAQEIYGVVEELSQLDNVCLCITSRISAIPPDCETFDIPTLSVDAARDTFHRICKNIKRSDLVDNILVQLDFHPLSITLLATVAHQNKWGADRFKAEWERQRTRMLQTMHNKSFAAAIELSLASPMFQELGPNARAVLEVIAFFPQGVDEKNLSWLFPIISNRTNIFDKLCVLSLTHRNGSFITMLAPLRDHLRPKDPKSSPLLRKIKDRYFTRLSADTDPNKPGFEESRWITSEDVNVEHLIDVFTTIDAGKKEAWDACADFIRHLAHHKQRLTILKPKIEALQDRRLPKPHCLVELSRLYHTVGNQMERKRLLTHALKIWRERGNDRAAARTLRLLSDANRILGDYREGIQQVEEALGIFKQLGATVGEARCSMDLARLLYADNRLDAAQETASRGIHLLSENGQQYQVCEVHRLLGIIYHSKGDREKAVDHLQAAFEMASTSDWVQQSFLIHCDLARVLHDEGKYDEAQTHVERAKSHTLNHTYYLGHATKLQAELWHKQGKVEDARSEALRAVDMYERLGATRDVKGCSELLRRIEGEAEKSATPYEPHDDDKVAGPDCR